MTVEAWWPQLRPETRERLTADNGDAVPSVIVHEIAALGGPAVATRVRSPSPAHAPPRV